MKRAASIPAVALALAALLGCAVPPAARARDAAARAAGRRRAVPEVRADWWNSFNDPKLDALVDEALRQQPRPRARDGAHRRVARRAARRARRPAAQRQRQRVGGTPAHSATNAPLTVGGGDLTCNDFRATLNVAYELDLWGRAANLSAAARDELLASEYARDTLRTALAAQVVQSLRRAAVARRAGACCSAQAVAGAARRPGAAARALRRRRHLRARHPPARGRADRQRSAAAQARPRARRRRTRAGAACSAARRRRWSSRASRSRPRRRPLRASGVPEGLPSDLLLRRPDVQAGRGAAARRRCARRRRRARPTSRHHADRGATAARAPTCRDLFDGPSTIWNIGASLDAADLGRRAHRRAVRRHAWRAHADRARLPRQRGRPRSRRCATRWARYSEAQTTLRHGRAARAGAGARRRR